MTVSITASRLYTLGWLLSFVFGGLIYWILCLIWPVQGNDGKLRWEALASDTLTNEERIPHDYADSHEGKDDLKV